MSRRNWIAAFVILFACTAFAEGVRELDIRFGKSPFDRSAYGPVPENAPFTITCTNGLALRNGCPFYWLGNGCDLGSGQGTPAGLWLAKLTGQSAVTLSGGFRLREKLEDDVLTLTPDVSSGHYSWYREAIRLGFLTESQLGSAYWSVAPLRKYAEKYPGSAFAEANYNAGHYITVDEGGELGFEIMSRKRAPYVAAADVERRHIVELSRELGPSPANRRAREVFRDWAKRKYGDLAAANAVWRTSFASWDEVLPHHLPPSGRFPYAEEFRRRKEARTDLPELYFDWMDCVQEDMARTLAREAAAMRAVAPHSPVTVDCRSHRNEEDNYWALSPELLDPHLDVFFIHQAFRPFAYRTPVAYDLDALMTGTVFPLFNYNFFLSNTAHPVFDTENIVSRVGLPGSDIAAMRANDLGALMDSPWRFRLTEPGDGCWKRERWTGADYDDSRWGTLAVPGCWDDAGPWFGKKGIGWYRKRFTLPPGLKASYEDCSRRFFLYGRGVAQHGEIWLNGRHVGTVRGWDTPYRFDIGRQLSFGGENVLVFKVTGDRDRNGIRGPCHVLGDDMINDSLPIGEKQYRQMLWTYAMRGASGMFVWNWNGADPVRPFLPDLIGRINAVTPFVQPDLRHRRSRVAYLYPFLFKRGLPSPVEGSHVPDMDWLLSLEFNGVRPEILGERTLRERLSPSRYEVLVVPHAPIVEDETLSCIRRFLADGGRLVMSDDSLAKTSSRYRSSGFAAKGSDRVTVIPASRSFADLLDELESLLPASELRVSGGEDGDRPLIERIVAGDERRKVVYLNNWGGKDRTVRVKLPDGLIAWRMTVLEGSARCEGGLLLSTIPAQDVMVALFERPDCDDSVRRALLPNRRRAELIGKVERLARDDPDSNRPKALFLSESPDFRQAFFSRAVYPYLPERARAFGFDCVSAPIEDWTAETLARCRMAFINENTSRKFKTALARGNLAETLLDWVEKGGSLFVAAQCAGTVNVDALVPKALGRRLGCSFAPALAESGGVFCFGDPRQPVGEAVSGAPASEGVGDVWLYPFTPFVLKRTSQLRPVVRTKTGAIAMVAQEFGRGRIFISADLMAFQPGRIEHGDNAALLENVVGWLARKPVDGVMRKSFREGLFITEADLR